MLLQGVVTEVSQENAAVTVCCNSVPQPLTALSHMRRIESDCKRDLFWLSPAVAVSIL